MKLRNTGIFAYFYLLDLQITNSYTLYKHADKHVGIKHKRMELFTFKLQLSDSSYDKIKILKHGA